MANHHSVVTKKGYLSRIISAIKGITMGLIFLIGAFYLLFWNEGRVDAGDVAVNAVAVQEATGGDFVYVSAAANSDENLADGAYLKPGDYLAVNRTVEMYSWVEKQSSSSDTNLGGSETTTTTYDYVMDWTASPANSSNFYEPAGHTNPSKKVADGNWKVSAATVGEFAVNMDKIDLPSYKDLVLNEETVNVGAGVLSGGDLYMRKGAETEPQIGDVRVSYSVVHDGMDVTVFGELAESKIVPYVDGETETTIYRMFDGTRDEALKTLHGEYATSLWLLRAIGFILMWSGFGMLLAPLSVVLDVIPAAGAVSRGLIGFVTFILSAVLTVLTIFVSSIFHNVYALAAAVVVALVLGVWFLKKKVGKPTVIRV